jgi:hypothetical protein
VPLNGFDSNKTLEREREKGKFSSKFDRESDRGRESYEREVVVERE